MRSSHFVAMQHLEAVNQTIGVELCHTLEFIKHKLSAMAVDRSTTAREFAQLREANLLINSIKHARSTMAVRQDEIAWALQYVHGMFSQHHENLGKSLLQRAADMLDIDLFDQHRMPHDLEHRIENELALLTPRAVA